MDRIWGLQCRNHRRLASTYNVFTPSSLSPAQRARAASRAISLSLHEGNIADAYHILNSIRLANSPSAASTTSHFQPVASVFTPDVSPRLPSHTLLHELIRQRLAHRASLLAQQMMRAGIKIRTRSLDVLFTALAQHSSPTQAPESTKSVSPISRSLNLHPGLISDSSTRFAVRLLLLARESRQRRTHNMFKTLIALCLINGEIILASLIFGVLVRDWQKRVQLGQLKGEEEEEMDSRVDNPKPVRATYDTPFPAWSHLNYMCEYIDESISACPSSPDANSNSESVVRYTASLQALANLAHLLDRRMLPIGGLTGLLQTMYKCPSGDVKVWVWERKRKDKEKRHPMELEAKGYFKNVLKRLALRLPRPEKTAASSSTLSRRECAPAPLTLQTYNTLLHYSLVHARARWMADKVLHHMLYVHQGIEPSGVTMNILEGAAMRSSVNGINKQWVEGWKRRVRENKGGGSKRGGEVVNEISNAVEELVDIAARYQQNHAEIVMIDDSDNYTLSMRIAFLIARGRPHVVVDALPALLPGINSLGTLDSISTSVAGDSAIRRAVAYGPVVMTSMLTALMKTGRTGLAERVWEVMKEAERQSWVVYSRLGDKGGDKVLSPWCLGVEAYTVMIKVYGKEARKGAGYGHDHRKFGRGVDTGKYMVVGWGQESRRRRKISRVQLGRQMGMKIYQTALKEEAITRFKFERLCARLETDDSLRIRVVKSQLRLPQPDAHFFNAILDIVARRPGMTPRSRASWTRRKARWRLRAKRKKYLWEGRVMGRTEPDARLKEVVRDIRRYGLQVPLLVRRILVGRDGDGDGDDEGGDRVWLRTT